MTNQPLPRWADLVVLPIVNLAVALLAAGVMVWWVGQDPMEVIRVLLHGAFGTQRGLSYTLYYATTFVFTGLSVAVAFHGGLFNIGAEGQAQIGGLGAGLAALALAAYLPAWLMLPLMVLAAMVLSFVLPLCVITVYRELPAMPELPVTEEAGYAPSAEPESQPFPG
mgnify:CR=1 FL=1